MIPAPCRNPSFCRRPRRHRMEFCPPRVFADAPSTFFRIPGRPRTCSCGRHRARARGEAKTHSNIRKLDSDRSYGRPACGFFAALRAARNVGRSRTRFAHESGTTPRAQADAPPERPLITLDRPARHPGVDLSRPAFCRALRSEELLHRARSVFEVEIESAGAFRDFPQSFFVQLRFHDLSLAVFDESSFPPPSPLSESANLPACRRRP